VNVEILPEPSDEERAAILAALEPDDPQPELAPWAQEGHDEA
jgi:hypothetical protein